MRPSARYTLGFLGFLVSFLGDLPLDIRGLLILILLIRTCSSHGSLLQELIIQNEGVIRPV